MITHLNTLFKISWLFLKNRDGTIWLASRLPSIFCYCADHPQLIHTVSYCVIEPRKNRLIFWWGWSSNHDHSMRAFFSNSTHFIPSISVRVTLRRMFNVCYVLWCYVFIAGISHILGTKCVCFLHRKWITMFGILMFLKVSSCAINHKHEYTKFNIHRFVHR